MPESNRQSSLNIATWKEGVTIFDLKEGDLVYIHGTKNGYSYVLRCKFIKYEKGLAYAEIIEATPYWFQTDFPKGKIVKVRKKSCRLWGGKNSFDYPHWHWCRKDGTFD